MKKNPNEHYKILHSDKFPQENYGIAAAKGDTQTLALINDALQKVRANGEYDRIRAQYFADTTKTNETSASESASAAQ